MKERYSVCFTPLWTVFLGSFHFSHEMEKYSYKHFKLEKPSLPLQEVDHTDREHTVPKLLLELFKI